LNSAEDTTLQKRTYKGEQHKPQLSYRFSQEKDLVLKKLSILFAPDHIYVFDPGLHILIVILPACRGEALIGTEKTHTPENDFVPIRRTRQEMSQTWHDEVNSSSLDHD